MSLVPRRTVPASGPVVEKMSARSADVGGLMVRRLLPNRRRTIGAWCFLDHFGPADLAEGALQVPPHPHIGLQTVTWLLEGEIVHLDSLGSRQPIRPGALNWMTAGEGIAHGEEAAVGTGRRAHGVQLWVALPEHARHGPPAFDHHADVPRIALEGATGQLLVGSLAGVTASARTFSPLLGAQLDVASGTTVIPVEREYEHGLAPLVGEVEVEGGRAAVGEIVHLGRQRSTITIRAVRPSTVLLLGGLPFEEDVLMWWNFVARTESEIRDARQRWEAGALAGPVPGASLPPLPAPAL